MVDVTLDEIKQLAPHARAEYLTAFSGAEVGTILGKYEISTKPLRVCHFLAQTLAETGGFHTLTESLNYSAERLVAVWPKHFHTIQEAAPYAHNEEKLGNFIYGQTSIAQKLGNTEPGDGYKFRGRGMLQITGRFAYTRYGNELNIDLVDNPDLAFDPAHSLSIAGLEWFSSGFHGKSCNQLADEDNIEGVTYAINGGQIGIEDRRIWLKRTKAIWLPAHAPFLGAELASRAVANLAALGSGSGPVGFAEQAVQLATTEWVTFGRQAYDIAGHALHIGHKEGEDPWYKRVGDYWREGVHNDTLDGRDHGVPWSAAFISWVMRTAGAGDRFIYSPQHSVYIYRAIRDLLRKRTEAGYWCYRLNEWKPRPGDIVCWARQAGVDYDHQNGGDYRGHCDIVVEVGQDAVDVIGGNVGDSVTKRPLALNTAGFLQPVVQGGETLFGVMRCLIGNESLTS